MSVPPEPAQQTEQKLAALRFQAAARDLEYIVRSIAQRYISQHVPLTWRLLHAIEAEALADLGFASRHDAIMLGLFQRPGDLAFPETDETVDFGQSNALPAVFAFAVSAYERAERSAEAARQQTKHHEIVWRARPWGG